MAINSLSASSYGMSGLVSGMNTQDMVTKLLSGTQSKIDKATQKKTTLQYKQSMYRDVANKLRALQDGFLSFTSKTNLLSNSFYNNMKSSVSPGAGLSAAFSVTASSNAKVGTKTVEYVKQLAQASSLKTKVPASGAVTGTFDKGAAANLLTPYTNAANNKLSIKVGSKTVEFADAPKLFEGKTGSEVAAMINAEFADKGVAAEVRMVNNKMVITADNKDDFIRVFGNESATIVDDRTLAMRMFGSGYSSLSGQGTLSTSVDTEGYRPSFEVNLDGRKENIHISLSALNEFANNNNTAPLIAELQKSLKDTFGTGVEASAVAGNTGITLTAGSTSQTFTVTGSAVVMATLGLKAGISNKLNTTNLALKDLNFATPLQGNRHTFAINGVEFSFTADTTLYSVMNEINNSKAGVNIRYIESEDRFVIQRSETGAGYDDITMSQTEGNLLTSLFNVAGGGSVSTLAIPKKMVSGSASDNSSGWQYGGTYTFNVNGRDQSFVVSPLGNERAYSQQEFADKMNQLFRTTYGTLPDGTQAVTFKWDDVANTFEIESMRGDVIKPAKYDKETNTSLLGFELGDSTVVTDANTKLSDLGISFGGLSTLSGMAGTSPYTVDLTAFDGNTTLAQIATAIQDKINNTLPNAVDYKKAVVEYDSVSGGFKITAPQVRNTDPTGPEFIPMETTLKLEAGDGTGTEKLFGRNSIVIGQPSNASITLEKTEGTNAIVCIDGVEYERASNSFELDGLTFTLHRTTVDLDAGGNITSQEASALVTTSRDTEVIVEGVKEFLKLYNETVNYLNGIYRAEATYKDYPPLTSEQKQNMSDREVELWEEKSKEGLLRNDDIVGNILEKMRKAMYTKPEGSSIAIYDVGIDTSYYSSDGNFKELSDGAIKAAIEKDADAFRQLFAGEGGIMTLLNDSLNAATRTSYGSPGTLIRMAGSSTLDTQSTIYKQIKDVDDQLTTLEKRYWNEYDRYWKQFNTMEQLIAQMNSQSSWLSQQFSG